MDTLYANARIAGTDKPQDLLVEEGRFTRIGEGLARELPAQGYDMTGIETGDLKGNLVCPPFCDTHLALEYGFTARQPGAANECGRLVRHGVQYIRSHADVTDPNLTSLKALLELREELKDVVTIQIVSFPQEGMYSYRGPHGETGAELVEEGLRMGADCVGGIPHYEACREFGERSMHTVVDLAVKYGRLIDVHCDETDDPNSRFVELLAALAHAEGIGEMTTASHTCSLGSADNSYFFHLTKLLKAARINFACAPQDTFPKRRGITRVKELTDNGINVSLGQDSMQDPWYPLGNGNMMIILDYVLHLAQMMSFAELDDALKFPTVNGATTMHLGDGYGIAEGRPANFIVLDATTPFEAVYERADVVRSVRAGCTLFTAETTVDTDLPIMRG